MAVFAEQGCQAAEQLQWVVRRRAAQIRIAGVVCACAWLRGRWVGGVSASTAVGFLRRLGRGACGALGARLGVALSAVLQIGQYAGFDQALVERGVDAVQALHDVGVKQGIEDHLYTQWKRAGRQGVTERLGNHLWAEGVDVFAKFLAVV